MQKGLMEGQTLDAPAMKALDAFCGSFESGRRGAMHSFLAISGRAFVRAGSRSLRLSRHWRRFDDSGGWGAMRVVLPGQPRVELPCGFDLIYRKTELRLFDFAGGTSIKVFLEVEPGSRRNARGESLDTCLQRELEGRGMAETAGIYAPRILESGDSPMPYLVEAWIPGRRFPRHPDFQHPWSVSAVSASARLARSHPPRLGKAGEIPGLAACEAFFKQEGKTLRDGYPAISAFLSGNAAAMSPDAPVLIAAAHGDFVPSNLVWSVSDSLCVLDWEACGKNGFGYDLLTYLGHCRSEGWIEAATDAMAAWAEACGPMAAKALADLGTALDANRETCMRHCVVQAAMSLIGSGKEAAAKELDTLLARCERGLEKK